MNTKLYKQVYAFASELLEAADKGDERQFVQLYEQLKTLCEDNESDPHKNHPVQWETLADFTEDSTEALAIYNKALSCAKTLNSQDYLASITYAIALLLTEDPSSDTHKEQALAAAQQASDYAANIDDAELQNEIADLLKTLQHWFTYNAIAFKNALAKNNGTPHAPWTT